MKADIGASCRNLDARDVKELRADGESDDAIFADHSAPPSSPASAMTEIESGFHRDHRVGIVAGR